MPLLSRSTPPPPRAEPAPPPLRPLDGPLGPREVLFTRHTSPVLVHARLRGRQWLILTSLAAVLLAPVALCFYLTRHTPDIEVVVAMLVLIAFALEYGPWSIAMSIQSRLRKVLKLGQFADLKLTMLRPLEIVQFLLLPAIRPPLFLLAATMSGLMLLIGIYAPGELHLALPLALMTLNGILTLYLIAWVQAALTLADPSRRWPTWFQIKQYMSGLILQQSLALGLYAPANIFLLFIDDHLRIDINRWHVYPVMVATVVPYLAIKYLLARSWADRIERVILQRVES